MPIDSEPAAIAARVRALPQPWLLALDVDGTLAPIAATAAEATIPASTHTILRRLAALPHITLALITGRDADMLSRLIDWPDIWRATEHGRVIAAPGRQPDSLPLADAKQRALQAFIAWATAEIVPLGATVERKNAAATVHVRRVQDRDAASAQAILARCIAEAERLALWPRTGRAICEAEADPGDKGQALQHMLATLPVPHAPIYAGDDVTDDPAIEVAAKQGGLGLFVSSNERPTAPPCASGQLEGPAQLQQLLAMIAG